ncbi:MAG: hypothetical protein ACRD3W_01085, partial [Terriglobales bacterium]
ALFCLWFGWRFLSAPRALSGWNLKNQAVTGDQAVILERSCDLLSLMLIIGPTVLADHFVLALPIALWSIVCAGRQRQYLVGSGAWLVLAWSFRSICPINLAPLGLIILALARRQAFREGSPEMDVAPRLEGSSQERELVLTRD